MTTTTTGPRVYIEIDGAMGAAECQAGGALRAMPIVGLRPYEDVSVRMGAAIAYARSLPAGEVVPIRFDTGHTWAAIGWSETMPPLPLAATGSAVSPAGAKMMVGLTDDAAVAAYERGALAFDRAVSFPGLGWVGCEFAQMQRACDLIRAAGMGCGSGADRFVAYLDFPGECTLTPWGTGVASIVDRLARSDRFRATLPAAVRAMSKGDLAAASKPGSAEWNARPDVERAWITRPRDVIDRSCELFLRQAGWTAPFIVAESSGPLADAIDDNAKVIPARALGGGSGQISWAGYYAAGMESARRARRAVAAHGANPVWMWSTAGMSDADLEAMLSFGAPPAEEGCSVVWGNPPDLPRLAAIAAMVRRLG